MPDEFVICLETQMYGPTRVVTAAAGEGATTADCTIVGGNLAASTGDTVTWHSLDQAYQITFFDLQGSQCMADACWPCDGGAPGSHQLVVNMATPAACELVGNSVKYAVRNNGADVQLDPVIVISQNLGIKAPEERETGTDFTVLLWVLIAAGVGFALAWFVRGNRQRPT